MASSRAKALLDIRNLTVDFSGAPGLIRPVNDVSIHIYEREVYGLVGESGSGKTMTALSVMRIVPAPGRITGGRVVFEGRDLLKMSEKEMESVRGRKIGMIFQEPMTALNPVFRVGYQIEEVLFVHTSLKKKERAEKINDLLRAVGFDHPARVCLQYPHQLSGGQRQRILIAMAVACGPSLVIADEPTTALDVATEGQILDLLRRLIEENNMAMLFITHDLHVMKNTGTRIGIMYAGRIMEENVVKSFFEKPLHPYSQGLLESVVRIQGSAKRLQAIPGSVPKLSQLPKGCTFHPRCKYVMSRCAAEEPPLAPVGGDKWVRCYLYQD